MKKAPRSFNDPIEKIVANALDAAGIRYIHDSENNEMTKGLDFLLLDAPGGVCIEVKQFHTPRTTEQMARVDNVIVIQGRAAAEAFAALIVSAKLR